MANKKFTDEDLLNNLRKFANEIGKTPSRTDFKKHNKKYLPSFELYIRRFQKYSKACRMAGLKPNRTLKKKYKRKSNKEMINDLIWFAEMKGANPTVKEMNRFPWVTNSHSYRQRFGSWKKAIEKAGLNNNDLSKFYSPKYLLHLLKIASFKKDKIYKKDRKINFKEVPNTSVYESYFGSLNNAYNKIGISLKNIGEFKLIKKIIPKEELPNDLLIKVLNNNNKINKWIYKNLNQLTKREENIIIKRYQLNDQPKKTLEELGKHYSLSRERIRQLQVKAIKKMRKEKEKLLEIFKE